MLMNNKLLKVNHPNVVHETIDGETILLDLKSGYYYSMDGSGSLIWDYLAVTGDRESLLKILREANAAQTVTINSSVNAFISQLLKEGVLFEDGTGNPANASDPTDLVDQLKSAAVDFVQPKLNKYADMQDLLLLDPIHDVDEVGWPEPKDEE